MEKGGWRYESARTQNRHDAEALLRLRAYEASAGNLPGTATFEQIIERLLDAAKVAGLKERGPDDASSESATKGV